MSAEEQKDLDLLINTAQEAGKIALRYFKKNPLFWMKNGCSPVSEADYAVDRFLQEKLTKQRPDYGWLSEEMEEKKSSFPQYIFVADPLDGTRGFLKGHLDWCISLALVKEGRSIAGVLDFPALGETYAAYEAGGVTLNGLPIVIKQKQDKEFFEVAGPTAMFDRLPSTWKNRIRYVEYIPSLACRLARVASGKLDAVFVKADAQDWDLAAADLILREAGGSLLGISGGSPRYGKETASHGPLAAGRGKFLDEMIKTLIQ